MKDRAIITSALPYANGEIHLGHVASTYIPADVTTRFLKLKGVEAYYVCATDDYGTPILVQSEKKGTTPQEYADGWNRQDAKDFKALDVNFDFFYRTSSKENIHFVQDVFCRLRDAGHIYELDVEQFYCKFDAKFLPDRYVHGTCPYCKADDQYSDLCEKCGRVPEDIQNPKCSMCGATPIKKTSKHYFFRLGSFADKLASWLDGNKNLQSDVKKYVQNWIKSGLDDWDITRDIPWGVPVPNEENKVFYGWFDNHLAYISSTVKLLESKGYDGAEFWNSSDIYHFIGKDIVYHHYLFLPAMRMGLDEQFRLPDYIPTRGHLTLQSRKISKSRNWYIGLREFLKYYPADYLRFYLVSINPYTQDDLNFDWDEFMTKINSELIGNLGNLINRTLGFTRKNFDGKVPKPETVDNVDKEAERQFTAFAEETGSLLLQNHLDRALKRILGFSAHFNQYFQHKEPWKGESGSDTCVYMTVNATRSIAIALSPFLPSSAQRIWDQIGLSGKVTGQSWDAVAELAVPFGHCIGKPLPLFTKVEKTDIEEQKKKFSKH
ncbi:MAG: methionyl-tRNA synthetase [Cenarchaeum symbiont of Oopsacas minuta]|nr:methionyl-tRNA synthetase [Cenarchaeum symbiont of Oopsacas minuta]